MAASPRTCPGGGTYSDFLGPDKPPKQVRREILAKKAKGIPENLAEGMQGKLTLNRSRGQVLHDWTPLLLIDVVNRDEANILWNAELRDRLSINKDRVNELFSKSPSAADNFEQKYFF